MAVFFFFFCFCWHNFLKIGTYNFCLEKYHIIKCDPSIPDEWWAYFKDDDYTIPTPFQTYSQYTTSVIAVIIIKKKKKLKAIEKVVKSLETTEEIPSTNQNFVEEFFHVCLYIYRRPHEQLSINKISFNHSFCRVWAFIVSLFIIPYLS